jgi:hypothetical protein
MASKSKSNVVHPQHYNACGETAEDGTAVYEPIKVITDWGLGWGFDLGNAIKYLLRAKSKGKELEDLRKALWYLRHAEGIQQVGAPGEPHPTRCLVLPTAKSWRLTPRRTKVLENIAGGWPGMAADELERELDEGFPGWRDEV